MAYAAAGMCFLVLHEFAHSTLGHLLPREEHDEIDSALSHERERQADRLAAKQLMKVPAAIVPDLEAIEVLFELLHPLSIATADAVSTHPYPLQRYYEIAAAQNEVLGERVLRQLKRGAQGFWYLRDD